MAADIYDRLVALPPECFTWCRYRGEIYFALPNYEKSAACHRPIIDLHYCATRAFNGQVLRSVNFKPELFGPVVDWL